MFDIESEADLLADLDNDFEDNEISDGGDELEDKSIEDLDVTEAYDFKDQHYEANDEDQIIVDNSAKTLKDLVKYLGAKSNVDHKGLQTEIVNLETIKHLIAISSNEPEIIKTLNEIQQYCKVISEKCYFELTEIYEDKFSELKSILRLPHQYAQCISLLEQGLELEQVVLRFEELCSTSRELIMVLNMSLRADYKGNYKLTDTNKKSLHKLTSIIFEAHDIIRFVSVEIANRIGEIAPNLCALLGTNTASLLVSHTGGLLQLSKIPSCNIANIGKKNTKDHNILNFSNPGGYIFQNELVQNQPIENHKQMMRMLSSKVSLAARVDAGLKTGDNNNKLGKQWRVEIEEKIKKIRAPPNISVVKALPIPEDKPKKKRAGRKFRKYKEQFKLSGTRQLQNRMVFGKQEATIYDTFGDEVGLGMTSQRKNGLAISTTGSSFGVKKPQYIQKKLKDSKRSTQEYIDALADRIDEHANLIKPNGS